MPTLSTGKTSIVAATVFNDWLLAKSLALVALVVRLAVTAAVPYWLALGWHWLPAAQLLRIRLLVVFLWLKLPLVLIASRLVFAFSNKGFVH